MSPPTMIVPRAYAYTTEKKPRATSSKLRKAASPVRPCANEKNTRGDDSLAGMQGQERTLQKEPGKPKRITSITHSAPSQPVVIPTRTSSPKKPRQETLRSPVHDQHHDPTALSPSMAALLAVTSIPRSQARAIQGGRRDGLSRADFRQSASSTSPKSWSILQSPADELPVDSDHDKEPDFDVEVGSVASYSNSDGERLPVFRTLSSDSIPSLDTETDAFASPESSRIPRTPSSSRRNRSPRREKVKILSSSQPLAVGETHPLAVNEVIEHNDGQEKVVAPKGSESNDGVVLPQSRDTSPISRGPSQFRSNLTASFQRLKSAAKAISLPSSTVSTVLAINSRVLPGRNTPTRPRSPLPLNNSAFSHETLLTSERDSSEPRPLPSDLYFSSTPSEEYRPISSSIQLQSYLRRDPDTEPLLDKATAPPIFLSSAPAPPILLPGIDSPRPREPRENSNFLRVVVLEMNMRRAGKLDKVSGRARIWIGPRAEKSATGDDLRPKEVRATRAERGMGEAVASELAEAMMVDGEEATMARSLQADEETTNAFDAAVHGQVRSRTRQTSYKNDVPKRWLPMSP